MSSSRRNFLQDTLASAGLAPFLGTTAGSHFLQRMLAATAQSDLPTGSALGLHDSKNFWDSFGTEAAAPPSKTGGRGLFRKTPDAGAGAIDRQIDFFHFNPADKALRFATSIQPKELLDHTGDVTASLNVNGFRMAAEDRDKFNQLQSAQLRIDVVQTQSIMQYLDPMAWMSLAGLFPGKTGKLPPLQNLSFDPAAASAKMQQIVLPGGSGQWAVNLSMAHKQSAFVGILQTLTNEVGRFAPILGLPAMSVTALKGFCSLYGAFEQRTTFLLNSFPQLAFATQAARELSSSPQGLNLVSGNYILVPHAFTSQLTPVLDSFELRQGYLVPKGSPTNSSIIDLALNLKPDITYLSASIGLKPLVPQAPAANSANSKA